MSNLIFPLPGESGRTVGDVLSQNGCANTGLILQKYVGTEKAIKDWKIDGPEKNNFFDLLIKNQKNSDMNSLFPAIILRWKAMVQYFNGLLYQHGAETCAWRACHFTARTRWRMVVGLGTASTLETSMTMHPVYGFPYIPGSSLKGIARAWAEDIKEDQALIDNAFGPEGTADASAGRVIFFDAMPEKLPELEKDIINAHYAEYYQGKAPPADWLSPIPVYFLAVKPGISFHFAVASKEVELAESACTWLKEGLNKYGIGSKTLVGYGHFDVIESKQGI